MANRVVNSDRDKSFLNLNYNLHCDSCWNCLMEAVLLMDHKIYLHEVWIAMIS